MSNKFFKLTSKNYNEIFDKWQQLTDDEISAAKSRIYVSVADIDLIQDAFQMLHEESEGLKDYDTRQVMQMGYALEEIKQKLIKRIALEERLKNNDPEEY